MRILFWFRKDLRLHDNTALGEAARDAHGDVVPFYASEPEIFSRPDMAAVRVRFALESLSDLAAAIEHCGSHLALVHGSATETVVRAARAVRADAVYWNDEYEPQLVRRDDAVERALRGEGFSVRRFHDRLLVPPGTVATKEGRPFVVYTAFRRACEALPLSQPLPCVRRLAPHDLPRQTIASLDQFGFATHQTSWPGGTKAAKKRLREFLSRRLARYADQRDFPAHEATARLSADLEFGTLSPRTVTTAAVAAAREAPGLHKSAERFISQLRWRDFYSHLLYHHPRVEAGAFRARYDGIRWRGDPEHFAAWQAGETGYPFVDAGMRELAATGFMHNRVRMVVASFLTKDLLLDWRLGERHFMQQLVDGNLANNNGGWQWAASTGTDAQPYFRIFNPTLQGKRFDPEGAYVSRWVPEVSKLAARWIHHPWEAPAQVLADAGIVLGSTYPLPIVEHMEQRDRAVAMYREALV